MEEKKYISFLFLVKQPELKSIRSDNLKLSLHKKNINGSLYRLFYSLCCLQNNELEYCHVKGHFFCQRSTCKSKIPRAHLPINTQYSLTRTLFYSLTPITFVLVCTKLTTLEFGGKKRYFCIIQSQSKPLLQATSVDFLL